METDTRVERTLGDKYHDTSRSHPIPNQKAESEFSTTKLRNSPSLEKHTLSRSNSGVHPGAMGVLLSRPAAPACWPLFLYLKKTLAFVLTLTHSGIFCCMSQEPGGPRPCPRPDEGQTQHRTGLIQ